MLLNNNGGLQHKGVSYIRLWINALPRIYYSDIYGGGSFSFLTQWEDPKKILIMLCRALLFFKSEIYYSPLLPLTIFLHSLESSDSRSNVSHRAVVGASRTRGWRRRRSRFSSCSGAAALSILLQSSLHPPPWGVLSSPSLKETEHIWSRSHGAKNGASPAMSQHHKHTHGSTHTRCC